MGLYGTDSQPGRMPGRALQPQYAFHREISENGRESRISQNRWREVIAEIYAGLDISMVNADRFSGRIRLSSFGRLDLTRVDTDGEIAHRTSYHIQADKDDYFLLNIALSGEAVFSQCGRECVVTPGKYTLLHTATPYSYMHNERNSFICLKIPSSVLEARVNEVPSLCGVAHVLTPGVAKVTANLLVSLDQQSRAIASDAAAGIESNLLDLIGMFLSTDVDRSAVRGTSVRWATHRRALAVMTEALGDVSLTPMVIAARLGISTRYLHRVFEDADESVAATLTRLRLEKSWRDLVDPRLAPMSIKQIAFRNGFKTQSHFTSVFRRRFDQTPKSMRAAAANRKLGASVGI